MIPGSHTLSKPTCYDSYQQPSTTWSTGFRRHKATPVTLGGSKFSPVTIIHFIKQTRVEHPSRLKKDWIEEPPETSQLHHLAPRPNVREIHFDTTRGIKSISPLGLANRPMQVPNFGANTNKTTQCLKMDIFNQKHKSIRLSQAAHRENAKNHQTWCMRVESFKAGDQESEKNMSSHARPQIKLNAARECASRTTNTHKNGVRIPRVQGRGVTPWTWSACRLHHHHQSEQKVPNKAHPRQG